MRAKQVHGLIDLLVGTFATARIRRSLIAFRRDSRNEILDADHLLAELFVDERCIREAEERTIGMSFAELDEILLAHQRLTARVDVDMNAQLFTLRDDRIDIVIGEIERIAIICRPATGAVQVASTGRIEQDGPRNVAFVLLAALLLLGPSKEVRIDDESLQQVIAHLRVDIGHDLHDELIPVVLLLDRVTDRLTLAREERFWQKRLERIHDLVDILLWVCKKIVHQFSDRCFFHCVCCAHKRSPSNFVIYKQD